MEQHAQSRVIEMLLVEDNLGAARLTKEAPRESTLDPCPDRGGRDADVMGARGFSHP